VLGAHGRRSSFKLSSMLGLQRSRDCVSIEERAKRNVAWIRLRI